MLALSKIYAPSLVKIAPAALAPEQTSMSTPMDMPKTERQLPSDDTSFFGHPRGLSTLFFTEMWERFSYYGLRPLLVLFMTAALMSGGFGFDRPTASAIVGIYAACVYLASLPGGWVADRLLGLRRSIMYGAVLISAGHISISFPSLAHTKIPFFIGLILIVLGTGLLKPNISAIVGDLYPEGGARRDAGFSLFYMGINTGAFLGQLVTGFLGEKVGWHFGFGAAGVGMLLGLAWFAIRSKKTLGKLGTEPSRNPDPVKQRRQEVTIKTAVAVGLGLLVIVIVLASAGAIHINPQAMGEYMTYVLVGVAVFYFLALFMFGGLTGGEKKRIGVIFILFVFAAIFWAAFEQAPTSLNLFARDFTQRRLTPSSAPSASGVQNAITEGFQQMKPSGSIRVIGLQQMPDNSMRADIEFNNFEINQNQTGAQARTPAYSGSGVGTIEHHSDGTWFLNAIQWGANSLSLKLEVGGWAIPAIWFQSVNSLFIILLAPLFAALWVTMARRGMELSSPAKFAIGLLLAGIGFALMIFAANLVVRGGGLVKVSFMWLTVSYLFQTLGELSLSPVGLSSMPKLSPRKYVGQMMGVWFLASSVGNLIAGLVGGKVDPEKLDQMPVLFIGTTVALVAAGLLLFALTPLVRKLIPAEAK